MFGRSRFHPSIRQDVIERVVGHAWQAGEHVAQVVPLLEMIEELLDKFSRLSVVEEVNVGH